MISPGGTREPVTFSFISDGPGLVSVSVVASAPTDSTNVCLSGDGGTPTCSSGATPTASFYSESSQSKWTASLVSATAGSPTIDVAASWPSNKASITVTHAPFQGAPNPDSLRSLAATIKARARGTIDLDAKWAPTILTVSLTVLQLTSSGFAQVDRASYNVTQAVPTHSTPVKANSTYQITLMNLSPAKTVPDLTATIAFP